MVYVHNVMYIQVCFVRGIEVLIDLLHITDMTIHCEILCKYWLEYK